MPLPVPPPLTPTQKTRIDGAIQEDRIDQPNGVAGRNAQGNIPDRIVPLRGTSAELAMIVPDEGEIATTSDTNEIWVGNDADAWDVISGGGGGGLSTIRVNPLGTPAENAVALAEAYTAAKSLLPNTAALSATNWACLDIGDGVYDFVAAEIPFTLDTPYIHVKGAGIGKTRLVTDAAGHHIRINQDNIRLSGMTLRYNQSGTDTGTDYGAFRINAGAGGSYAATNTGLLIEDVAIENSSSNNISTSFHSDITAFGGTYRNITSSGGNLFSARAQAISVSATFENCHTLGGQTNAQFGGSFGGTTEGTGPNAPNIFTGVLRRCSTVSGRIGLLNRGLVEYCNFTCTRNSQPVLFAGTSGKFYYNRLKSLGTGSPYSIGHYETATISAAHNMLMANGINSGAGITNNLGTPYNVEDDGWS